ncbi:MAG TPA: alanine dehydrogenase [Chromatiales bacterium]|nr:alanine dehydrogenase [Thiotrichales bacterium]HIP67556.1 alanine dehydrogenase [Chromatiales bacterium]
MRVGVPKETKPHEGRVALTPHACAPLVAAGHEVYVEKDGGRRSGYQDEAYQQAGVIILPDAKTLYATADIIVKVKEPAGVELDYLQAHHLLFSFLHLAANPSLAERLRKIGLTAFAFETLGENGEFPLLAPMSRIAGKIAVQIGAHLLHEPEGGSGVLLGGVADSEPGQVLVLGAGQAGSAAATVASALGATVTVLDNNSERLTGLQTKLPGLKLLNETGKELTNTVAGTDLLIGAIMVAGAKAPVIVSKDEVQQMRAGSVIVDIAIDQGGCVATSRPTDYNDPVYNEYGVQHCCVTNLPGAVPRTATQALSARILPYLETLLTGTWHNNAPMLAALSVMEGRYQHPALIKQFVA